jgi:hypothetical protein
MDKGFFVFINDAIINLAIEKYELPESTNQIMFCSDTAAIALQKYPTDCRFFTLPELN